jgi:iron complex outermembrane receptor protein
MSPPWNKRSAKLAMCLVVFSLCLLVQPAHSQAGTDQDLMSLSIEDLAKTKVFSASRHLEDTRQAPSSVSIVTADDIQRHGWRTLADIIGSLRGFYTSYDRDYTYLGVRGVQRPGDYNSRILLMINGHRLNDNVYDSALLGTEFPLDLDLIDHIEIVRGPSSSLFGTNAIFGVINVITRRPANGAAIEASTDGGSFLTRSGRVTGTYKDGRLSALLSGSLFRSGGQSDLYYPEYADTNNGIAGNLDGSRYAHAFADVQYGGFRLQSFFGSRIKDIPTASYGSDFDHLEQSTDARGYVELSYHRNLSAATDLDIRTYYDWYQFSGDGVFGDPASGDGFYAVIKARSDWLGTEATIGRQFGQQRLTVGADYEYSPKVWQENDAVGLPPVLNATQSPALVAFYGEAELNIVPKLTFRLGGRLDWFDSFGTALSPRAAAVYQPNSLTALKYIFARAFRAPSAYEDYYTDGVSIIAPANPLKPEHIVSHEVVLERKLNPWLSLTADGFYNNLTNLIDEVPDNAGDGLNQFVNVGHDRGLGFEVELEAKRQSGWAARASYTGVNTRDLFQNTILANSPGSTVKFQATAPVSRRAFLGMDLAYASTQTSYQATHVSPSFPVNITFSTKPLWRDWQFSASCYDAFNQRWYSPAGPGLEQAAIQQDGRTYRFKISYRLPVKESRSK